VPEPRAEPNAQTELPAYVAGLLRQDAFDHAAADVEIHGTHISWVILAGSHAYKIKKPVKLGFVDFSTLELRAADYEDEVRLNRRLCPDAYLGVVQIVEQAGAYRIGGSGTPVEPAVHMRRLSADGMLPGLVARGEADPSLFKRIARHLARFHATAATGPGVDEFGSLATVRSNWDENFQQTESFVGRTLAAERRDTIRTFVNRFVEEHADLFEQRLADGRVRDGHGDLHLDSICVEGRRLYLFDCIEFAPRFRCADVAAEVAFLAMDLDHNGRADLAGGRVVAKIDMHFRTAVGRRLNETDRAFVTDVAAFAGSPDYQLRCTFLDEIGIPLDGLARRRLDHPMRTLLARRSDALHVGHELRQIAELAPELIDVFPRPIDSYALGYVQHGQPP